MRFREQRAKSYGAISLTPLIDVVFILLVFFLLASSFLEWRSIALKSPVQVTEPRPESTVPLILEVTASESIVARGQAYAIAELRPVLEGVAQDNPKTAVIIRPEPGAAVQTAIWIMDMTAAVGLANAILDPAAGAVPDAP